MNDGQEVLQQSPASAEARLHGSETQAPGRSPFLPLLLAVLAVLLWSSFQCYQIFRERQVLVATAENQQRQVEESAKVRGSLDAIARETARLADKGNAGARMIIDELRKRGVTINPNSPTQPASEGK